MPGGAGSHGSAAEPGRMPMTDPPWQGDACSLVDAFRAGERSPVEELEATLAAIEASDLNCFSHVDPERAMQVATVGRRVPALRRRAHRDQAARPGGGMAAHRGVARVRGPRLHLHVAPVRAALRSGAAWCRSARPPRASSAASTSASARSTASRTTRGATAARWVARRAGPRRRWPAVSSASRPAATAAARSASRPATRACSA